MDANQALGSEDFLSQLVGAGAANPKAAPSPAPTGSLGSVNTANKNLQNTLSQQSAAQQPAIQKFQQTAAQPMPQPPSPKQAAPAPEAQQFAKDSQGWINALAVFSSLIGARGRNRGTGALKAYAAGINGIKQGNQQAFDDSYKTWKANTDAMFKENDDEMAKYKAVLENRDFSEAEANQQMKMIGAEYQNKVMSDTHTADQAFAVYDSMVKARAGIDAYTSKMEAKKAEMDKQQQDKDDKQDALIQSFSGLKDTDIVPGYGVTKAAIMDKVRGLQSGLNYPDVGISMRGTNNPLKDLVDSIKAETDAGGNRADEKLAYQGQQAETRAIAARSAPAKIAVKEMDNLAQPMVDAVKRLNPSSYPDLNSLKNAAEKRTGGEDVVKANLAVQEFKTAFTNLMIRNGVPTDAARSKADAIMDSNFSLGQIEAVRDQAKISGAAVLDALSQVKGGVGASQPLSPGGRIKIITPDGKTGTIDASHLDELIAAGGRKAE